jgi:hypothetical protein
MCSEKREEVLVVPLGHGIRVVDGKYRCDREGAARIARALNRHIS